MKNFKLISLLFLPFLLASQTDIQNLGVIYVNSNKVGIGKTDPNLTFDVNGQINAKNFLINKNSSSASNFLIEASYDNPNDHVVNSFETIATNKVVMFGLFNRFGNAAQERNSGGFFGIDENADFFITTRKNLVDSKRLYISKDNGYVGIGTTSPTKQLSVNGGLESEQIEVKADVADYVFKSDYNIISIKELEEYIIINGHLPKIQNQKDVDANNGYVDLGKLSISLMEKVEELTLYIINLNKRIISLESKLE